MSEKIGLALLFLGMAASGYGLLAYYSKKDRGTWKFWDSDKDNVSRHILSEPKAGLCPTCQHQCPPTTPYPSPPLSDAECWERGKPDSIDRAMAYEAATKERPLNIVPIPNKQRESCIEYARSLLARCEDGSVVAVTVLEELPDGTYTITGGETMSRLQTAGALLDAAISRLK